VRIAQVGIWVEFEIVGEYLIDLIDLWTDPDPEVNTLP